MDTSVEKGIYLRLMTRVLRIHHHVRLLCFIRKLMQYRVVAKARKCFLSKGRRAQRLVLRGLHQETYQLLCTCSALTPLLGRWMTIVA